MCKLLLISVVLRSLTYGFIITETIFPSIVILAVHIANVVVSC
ncbi:hypothetical protein CLOBOL_03254 [Enterocloster bolteae ATCC BAA-613]|uniref:Uncharacterized protein n=1 Tax=Enterocloster bolteae (strain ATCC BAA-613 / DSM 15670 / CCUG 46953 / JCM 12243 / WAL 16351) TaxID=411902 RepID=A8RSA6_ENTBW|nr:hypothetical protein CLOBOL_03254 [Enterocloster bolteae ATCC BAA-613]